MQIVTKNGFVLDCWCNLDSSAWLQPATLDVPEGVVLGEGWKKRIHGGGMIEKMSVFHIVCLYSWLVKVSRYVLVLLLSNSPFDRLIKILVYQWQILKRGVPVGSLSKFKPQQHNKAHD